MKNRLYLLLPIRSLMFVGVFMLLSLMSGEKFLSFLPLTLWICYWYYKNRNPLPIMIGHGILNVATAVNILVTSAVPSVYEMMM